MEKKGEKGYEDEYKAIARQMETRIKILIRLCNTSFNKSRDLFFFFFCKFCKTNVSQKKVPGLIERCVNYVKINI